MKARKMMIAVFALTLAVQMTGCKNDMDTNKPIVIDVSVSDSDVASKAELNWTELGKLTNYEEMRTAVDTIFGNEIVDGVKYGAFYLDKDEKQCTNNTLSIVLGNQFVAEEMKGSALIDSLNSSLDAIYTDLSDSDCTAAMFNAYFNLLPDSTPNYFNGGDTLSRAEAMALVTRATTPVKSLPAVDGFEDAVTGTDYDQYINYAAQQNANSYINTQDKSLTADNFKGAMSRAEFVYLVMNEVYGTENVQSFDTASASLKDCTNAGDLSAELKIAGADRCNAYTLSHSLQNVDKGVTEELYKSLVMAVEKGIITPETRWNEGITKAEAIEIVVNAFNQYYEDNGYLLNNADKGSTQVLEAQAEELWNKQDANDMSVTKEQFIADYVRAMSEGITPEEFEESIGRVYSISYAEELEKIEEEQGKAQEEAVKKAEEEAAKAAEETQQQSSNNSGGSGSSNTGGSSSNNSGESSNNSGSSSNNGGSSNGGGNSSNNSGAASGENNTPVYTPPADNDGGSNNYTPPVDNVVLPDGFFDMPDDLDDWGDQSDWQSWE